MLFTLMLKTFLLFYIGGRAWENLWAYPFNGINALAEQRDINRKFGILNAAYNLTRPLHLSLILILVYGWNIIDNNFSLSLLGISVLLPFIGGDIYYNHKWPKTVWCINGLIFAIIISMLFEHIYCSFKLQPHFPIRPSDLIQSYFIIAKIVLTIILLLISYYKPLMYKSKDKQISPYFFKAIFSILFILSSPSQFNQLLYYTYFGGGRPITIIGGRGEEKASYIMAGKNSYIAWPLKSESPTRYTKEYFWASLE